MTLQSPIVLVGFGSQAKAWALNLRDSKQPIKIALRPNSARKAQALAMGFECIELEDHSLKNYSLFIMLIPDDTHHNFFEKNQSYLKEKSHFIYAHGFSLSKDLLHQKYPNFSHSLLAP
ncbi:MAG: hypothetical protein EHM20_05910, partial [Alphaproteobacteria bacterium]